MSQTQKHLIIKYLEQLNDWIPAFKLRGQRTDLGFLGHQADRRARELYEAGLIERRLNGKFAEYKSKKPEIKQTYNIIGRREGILEI